MALVTGETKESFDKQEMEKRSGKEKEHPADKLPGVEGSKVEAKFKERNWKNALGMSHSIQHGIFAKMPKEEYQEYDSPHGNKYYTEDLKPFVSRDKGEWKHQVSEWRHRQTGKTHHVVLSQDRNGYSIRHYTKD